MAVLILNLHFLKTGEGFSDALIIAGLLLVIAGAWWIYPPVSLILGGIISTVSGVLLGMKTGNDSS